MKKQLTIIISIIGILVIIVIGIVLYQKISFNIRKISCPAILEQEQNEIENKICGTSATCYPIFERK